MHRNVRNRLLTALTIIILVGSGAYLLLYYMSDNIVFFISPSEINNEHLGKKIRLGGLVKKGSVKKYNAGETMFILTDDTSEMKVKFKGILPSLFREDQGMVAEGIMRDRSILQADRLLTKHDENYKPPKGDKK